MTNRKQGRIGLAAALAAVVISVLACGGGASPDQAATVDALSTSVAGTATARAGGAVASKTAVVGTAAAQANTQELASAATAAATAAQGAAANAATATAIAPMLAELPSYGVDPAAGRPGWVHPPVNLFIEGPSQYDYANQFLATVAGDFVAAADITWNTRFGDSGCGLVLRSDGNEESLNQYLLIATRAANGHVLFAVMESGEVTEVEDMYARGIDPLFTSANDTTNRLAVVARGSVFNVYTNGTFVGQVINDRYQRGFVALVALNNSGHTTCQFTNTWLWLFNQ